MKIYILSILFSVFPMAVSAKILPLDSSIVTGKLANGISYYIKYNNYPRGQVSFHLVHNIGSLAEEKDEYGIAHFIEHIAFQGTRRFPNRGVVEMLERHGVMFSHDVNAVTSQNHTIYQLSGIPVENTQLLDSCIMVMADWAHDLTLDDAKINKERGVIIEEIKMRHTPEFEAQSQWANTVLKGSRYTTHDIIGSENQIATFESETLRTFYRKWHRPDLEAVVIVGDIDVADIERRLRSEMSKVPKAEGSCPLISNNFFSKVPDHDEVRFCAIRQEHSNSRSVIIINRVACTPETEKNTLEYMKSRVAENLINIMAAKRAKQLTNNNNTLFLGTSICVIPLKRGYFTYQFGASLADDDESRALRLLMLEYERLRQKGFSEAELVAAVESLKRDMRHSLLYSSRDNEVICTDIENSYLEGEPLLSPSQRYDICSSILENINIDDINSELKRWSSGKNQTIVVSGRQTEYSLTEKDAMDIVKSVRNLNYDNYPYVMPTEPIRKDFLNIIPKQGKLKKQNENKKAGYIEWTFENGARVIFKPIKQDKSIVCLNAVRRGGTSLFPIDDLPAAEVAGSWILSAGAGDFDSQSLDEQIQLHELSFSPSVNLYSTQITGNAMPDEAEALFQLIHLYLTRPSLDSVSLSMINRQVAASSKSDALADSIALMRTNYSPRTLIANQEYYKKAIPECVIEAWKKCFGLPSAFTYVITGNISIDEALRLSKTYIASLPPSDKKKHTADMWIDNGIRMPQGRKSKVVNLRDKRSLATLVVNYNYYSHPSVKDIMLCELLGEVFQMRCMKNIREKEGNIYAVTVHSEVNTVPVSEYSITAELSCSPSDVLNLRNRIFEEWNRMTNEGVNEEELSVVMRHFAKKMLEDNDDALAWVNSISRQLLSDSVIVNPNIFNDIAPKLTLTAINDFLFRMNNYGNRFDLIVK